VPEREPLLEAQRWGDDPKLVELLGARGAAGFRALFNGFPDAVGVLWAVRDDDGRIVDFTFGYGNPSILRAFRLPAATLARTLLTAGDVLCAGVSVARRSCEIGAMPDMRSVTMFSTSSRGGSLRSPPAPAAGGRKRPSSPALRTSWAGTPRRDLR
jgi:hypothetical protein